jgi:hypothetical protein
MNRNALRNLILREMHDHMVDMPEIEPEIVDDNDDVEMPDEDEDEVTSVKPDGGIDYEDSGTYEEAGMIKSNLYNMAKKSLDLHDKIGDNDDLPEWVQEKIAVASYMIDCVHDYLCYEMIKDDLHEKKDGRSKARKYKGKEYHATPAMVKAVKKGASYNQLAKLAKWADEPAAVVQAAKIVAKGKPMTRDDESELDEGEGWKPLHQSTGIMFFEEDEGADYPMPKSKAKKRG